MVVVGVVVTGGDVVVCGGGGLPVVGGGGGGGGGAEPVPAYAAMVSTEPTANSRNDAPTNPNKPLVFIYPRMCPSALDGDAPRVTTSRASLA